ncbi:hypothetical protein [Streptomyces sp. NPDC023588]|uniref:hypothetical protein n=1 Tax=Streptomyces sp. NPDC023588 TaxID=3154907 RepID=UPI0033FCF767
MESTRQTGDSGPPLQPRIGFSRAVRRGSYAAVADPAPLGNDGFVEVEVEVALG